MPHFKIEDIRTACKLITQNCFMANLDLKNAYFLVPVDEKYRKFLRFYFENILFEFNCLPFGLNISPFVFTKIMKPVVSYLSEKGFFSVVYLDDFLLLGASFEASLHNVQTSIALLQSLGFVINYEESSLIPNSNWEFLGFDLNSESLTLGLTSQKRDNLIFLIDIFFKKHSSTIREFAKIIGRLVSGCPAIPYGIGYTKALERAKFQALLIADGNYDERFFLPSSLHPNLVWLRENIRSARSPIRQFTFETEIFSDASKSGWGAFCKGESAHGFWNEEKRSWSINRLELLAVFWALKTFASDLEECEILLRVDNTTTIAYINKMGGIQYPNLHSLSRQIWGWCESRKLWIHASYIASKENVEADRESRIRNVDTEWELANYAFQEIIRHFPNPDIDLFASKSNSKCISFCTWIPDPDAVAFDAFTIWKDRSFYTFPPFSMILRTLRKIITDEACGIVVVPRWTSQPWFPLFQSMILGDPSIFPPLSTLLLSRCRSRRHPLAASLTLVVGWLSGKVINEKSCRIRH